MMDFKGPHSFEPVGTNSGLDSIKPSDFYLVDPQMRNNQKQPGIRMAAYSNPFCSSDSISFGTPSSTTNSGTAISISYWYPTFPLLNNSLANVLGSMVSSGCSSMNPSTQNNYISSTTPNTSTISACSPSPSSASSSSSTSSSGSGRQPRRSTTTKRKYERLIDLTAEQKLWQRKERNRLAAKSSRDRRKAQQFDLKLTVARLRSKNAQLQAQQTTLRREHEQVKSVLELVLSTKPSLNATCPYCDYLHQVQGHNNVGSFKMADNLFGSCKT